MYDSVEINEPLRFVTRQVKKTQGTTKALVTWQLRARPDRKRKDDATKKANKEKQKVTSVAIGGADKPVITSGPSTRTQSQSADRWS